MLTQTPAASWSLRDYDALTLGPVLGVSDDGDSAPAIVRAFLSSPKSRVLATKGLLSLQTIGACLDAERMSAAGELPVGPPEYDKVRAAVGDAVPMTTNVGTVVLPRFFRPMPFVIYWARARPDPYLAVETKVVAALAPFVRPPGGGAPRPATVYVAFPLEDNIRPQTQVNTLRRLSESVSQHGAGLYTIGLLQRARGRNASAAHRAIDIAARAGIGHVLIEGGARYESQDQLMLPGLLVYYDVARTNQLLEHARRAEMHIGPKNRVDVDTAARTIWAGLTAARVSGAHLGKFGLFPLTADEQARTVEQVMRFFPEWTACPAFYVDRPVVGDRVYTERELVAPMLAWLGQVARSGASVVLVDSPDRTPLPAGTARRDYQEDRGRRLLKRTDQDAVGVLTWAEIDQIREFVRGLQPPVRVMWAGGLDGRQAFELARRGEFAIFTTSTTARHAAVSGTGGDPTRTSEVEPTFLGVLAVKMVIEAGFLVGRAQEQRDARRAAEIETRTQPVLDALAAGRVIAAASKTEIPALAELGDHLIGEWEHHLSRASAV